VPKWIVENSNEWEEIIEIPEYVKCTKYNLFGSGEVGKIYKVKDLKDHWYILEGEEEEANILRFVPSTKEEYNAQFKKPLFTTEDNVPIYEGDKYWYCWKDCKAISVIGEIAIKSSGRSLGLIYFSTKQAAEEYIAKNKVRIITEDGISLYNGDNVWIVENLNTPWTAFIKEKEGLYFNIIEDHSKGCKFFSTLEKAKEFIDLNTVQYSLKDVQNMFIAVGYQKPYYDAHIRQLKHS